MALVAALDLPPTVTAMTTTPLPTKGTTATLPEEATGTWRIVTESSQYLLDLDARTIVREPGAGAIATNPDAPEFADVFVRQLRRDGDVLPLVSFTGARVGERMPYHVDVLRNGTTTLRFTTHVQQIIGTV